MEWSKDVFAENLKYYMDKTGRTQREIAEVVGVSAPTVSDWCTGKKFPRIDRIERLALYFGILKSDLIEKKQHPRSEETAPADPLSETKQALLNLVSGLSEAEAAVLLASLKTALGNLPKKDQ